MNDILTFNEIPVNLRTANIGVCNARVYICPECDNDMCETNFEHAIGFGTVVGNNEVVMVVECDKCGTRFYSHASKSTYHCFLLTMERISQQKIK